VRVLPLNLTQVCCAEHSVTSICIRCCVCFCVLCLLFEFNSIQFNSIFCLKMPPPLHISHETNVHQRVCMSNHHPIILSFKVTFGSARQQCLSISYPAPLQTPRCSLSAAYKSTVLQYNLLHVCCHLNPLPFVQTPRWRVATIAALWPSYGLWTICEGASGALFVTMHCESYGVIPEADDHRRFMAQNTSCFGISGCSCTAVNRMYGHGSLTCDWPQCACQRMGQFTASAPTNQRPFGRGTL